MKKITKISLVIFALTFFGSTFAQNTAVPVSVNENKPELNTSVKSNDNYLNSRVDSKDNSENNDVIDKKDIKQSKGVSMSEEHRSAVAKYVQGLINLGNKDKTIGEQVKIIAQSQNNDTVVNTQIINQISSRSKIKTFFFGSDYKNLGMLRSSMVKTNNEISQLKDLLAKATTPEIKTDLENQIKLMEIEKTKIDSFIKTNLSKFSLFGWLRAK